MKFGEYSRMIENDIKLRNIAWFLGSIEAEKDLDKRQRMREKAVAAIGESGVEESHG